jgi:hypothetical protein
MRARVRTFLEKSYQGYYAKGAFQCGMFLMITTLFALTMVSAGIMLTRQWHSLAWPQLAEMVLLVVMAVYPWLFELRAHGQIRCLLREQHGNEQTEAAKGAAAYSLGGLAFAYAVAGWAFSLLAKARIH